MSNIRIEMNYYAVVKKYVVIVLFDDEQGVSSSLNFYPNTKREAKKMLAEQEAQYGVKGTIN